MQGTVVKDNTVRVIGLELVNVPDIDVTRTYHRKPRVFRPERATLRIENGQVQDLKVYGGLVLKSGAASTSVQESWSWHCPGGWGTGEVIDKAPEWARLIWEQAPNGVTTWRTGVDAGEVQPL